MKPKITVIQNLSLQNKPSYINRRELGCREIKCIETPNTLLEEDRTQLTETMKRQLNVRIMKAKSIKEFQTFGFFIYGFEIELYVMRFDKENGYQLYLSQNITLSTTSSSYSNLDITLGLLLAFKNIITASLSDDTDATEPYIYNKYVMLLKPTVEFVNE
ncbi:hypothetical protein RO3G_04398 [Rhizopus delemar RA 99-880]|uniref:Uncharacterized protein n=1 Tax=Rhizopus delemar (strain RA 99-880 / ATCC MYA-4621 / FGSC 9543 / NRRL 43880) TaxID=246409 RepID=I1BU13_RHIO9|nr:hypothetical protein RO3G_04398 [Rhizopus delemar RA 99-880]|eukprot:EIE79693.1 hypothetical protein RO3G_04398 [Rhizopus delemar RA 99-880]